MAQALRITIAFGLALVAFRNRYSPGIYSETNVIAKFLKLKEFQVEIVHWLVGHIRPHTDDLALAMVATALVIFGDHINELLRMLVKRQRLWLRMLAFIALCSVGYGALTVWLTPLLESFLRNLPGWQLLAVISGSFIGIALLAQKQRRV